MEWLYYVIALGMAAAITASAVYAFQWSVRRGELRDLEKGALSIFDENEPVGKPTDHFPGKRRR